MDYSPFKNRTKALSALTLVLLALILGGIFREPLQSWIFPATSHPTVSVLKALQLKPHAPYTFLRQAEVMGNRFVMLKHTPTSQRIILLTGTAEAEDAYNSLYNQNLSTLQFMILIQAFKGQSSYDGKDIQVKAVQLKSEEQVRFQEFNLPYKTYQVATTVDGHPQNFEALIGKIESHGHPQGLVFTFNSQNAVFLPAFTDILPNLKPTKP